MPLPQLPNTNIPQVQGMPSLGDGAKWFEMGSGTVGDLLYQLQDSMRQRRGMEDQLAQQDVNLRQAYDPVLMKQLDMEGNMTDYMNTPERIDILGRGRLGEAQQQEASGIEALGTVGDKVAQSRYKTAGIADVYELNKKHDIISEAIALGQSIGGNTLHPMLGKWKESIGKVVESFGYGPGTPQYEKAMEEWAIPSEATLGVFDKVQKSIALRTQEHLRALDLQGLKNRGALDVANANNKDDDNAARKDKIAMIRYYQTNIQEHRKGVRELEKAKAIAKGQAMLMYGHIKDPTERQMAIDSFLEEYDTAITGQWEEIRSLEEQLRGVDPNYKPGPGRIEKSIVPGQKKPRMEPTDAGGGEAPQGDLRPVDKPNVTIKRGGSPSDSATVSGKGPSASGKIRKGPSASGETKQKLNKEDRLKILYDELNNITWDEYLTDEEKAMRMRQINKEILLVESGRG